MMPGLVMQLGLRGAIEDICEQNTLTGKTTFHFSSFGNFDPLDKKKQINIYYIINELINNIIKHSSAKEATVQLNAYDNELNIIIEDDGIGFNVNEVLKTESKDLQTVKSRVRYLHGTLNIDSQPGRGTSIIIDFPLNNSSLKA